MPSLMLTPMSVLLRILLADVKGALPLCTIAQEPLEKLPINTDLIVETSAAGAVVEGSAYSISRIGEAVAVKFETNE